MYFDENRRTGITTAEDDQIIEFLGQDDETTYIRVEKDLRPARCARWSRPLSQIR